MKKLIFFVVVAGVLGWGTVLGQVGCDEGGQFFRETYRSDVLGGQMVYTVYLPPCYDQTGEIYPVLYLLHGSNEDGHQWQRLGIVDALDAGIAAGTVPPVIVIMPFGDWVANRNDFDGHTWDQVLLHDLMPLVESSYRVDARREMRAIGGISRGGFWAYHVALRYPELFGAIGGHSAFFDPYHAPPAYNPLNLIETAPGIEPLRFWLDRGVDDFAAPGLDIMQTNMQARGLPDAYTIYPEGQHNNAYWRQHLDDYLAFYTAAWGQSARMSSTSTGDGQQAALFVTATPHPTLEPPAGDAQLLFVPVVAFPSLQTTLPLDRLESVAQGAADPNLVIDTETAALLASVGIDLHPDIPLVEPEMLLTRLWRDRMTYALLPFDRLTTQYRVLWVDDLHPVDRLDDYPFVFASETPNYDPSRLTRITLSGVTALARNTRVALDQHGIGWAAEAILPYVKRADFFHISNEVSFYPTCPQDGGVTLGGSSSFCARREHFDLLPLLDVDIVELSGNHNNDYGYDAYRETLAFYREQGFLTVGGGEDESEARQPLIINHHGNRIAWVVCNAVGPYYALANDDPALLGGVRPGAASCDRAWLRDTLTGLAAEHDFVLVTVQHLEHEDYLPDESQRFDFRQMALWGADVVIGTAPHKPQVFEFYGKDGGGAFLHYGLGNLFFDQPFWGNTRFFMDTLYIYEGLLLTVDLFPGIIEEAGRPRLMTLEERENFLYFMFAQQNGF